MTVPPRLVRAASVALFVALAGTPSAQVVVLGALAHDHEAEPGETYEVGVVLGNLTDEAQEARLYLCDYHFDAQGRNAYGAPGEMARSNANWLQFAPPVVTLPPRSEVPVTVSVTVPGVVGTTAPWGTYWSMLMVEGIPRGSAESTLGDPPDGTYGVQKRTRYGVQIATHVGPLPQGEVALGGAVLETAGGRPVFAVDVENVGDRLVEGRAALDVFDAEGVSRGRFEGSRARVYPGTSFRFHVPLDGLELGTYEALWVLDATDDVFGAPFTLDL